MKHPDSFHVDSRNPILFRSIFFMILSICLVTTLTIPAYAAKLVDEEEIYQSGKKEHRAVKTEKRTQPRVQNVPESNEKTGTSSSSSSNTAKTKAVEKKSAPPKVVKTVNNDSIETPQKNIFLRAWEWISPTYRGPWIPVWNWIFLLIGILVFIKLAAEYSIRRRRG